MNLSSAISGIESYVLHKASLSREEGVAIEGSAISEDAVDTDLGTVISHAMRDSTLEDQKKSEYALKVMVGLSRQSDPNHYGQFFKFLDSDEVKQAKARVKSASNRTSNLTNDRNDDNEKDEEEKDGEKKATLARQTDSLDYIHSTLRINRARAHFQQSLFQPPLGSHSTSTSADTDNHDDNDDSDNNDNNDAMTKYAASANPCANSTQRFLCGRGGGYSWSLVWHLLASARLSCPTALVRVDTEACKGDQDSFLEIGELVPIGSEGGANKDKNKGVGTNTGKGTGTRIMLYLGRAAINDPAVLAQAWESFAEVLDVFVSEIMQSTQLTQSKELEELKELKETSQVGNGTPDVCVRGGGVETLFVSMLGPLLSPLQASLAPGGGGGSGSGGGGYKNIHIGAGYGVLLSSTHAALLSCFRVAKEAKQAKEAKESREGDKYRNTPFALRDSSKKTNSSSEETCLCPFTTLRLRYFGQQHWIERMEGFLEAHTMTMKPETGKSHAHLSGEENRLLFLTCESLEMLYCGVSCTFSLLDQLKKATIDASTSSPNCNSNSLTPAAFLTLKRKFDGQESFDSISSNNNSNILLSEEKKTETNQDLDESVEINSKGKEKGVLEELMDAACKCGGVGAWLLIVNLLLRRVSRWLSTSTKDEPYESKGKSNTSGEDSRAERTEGAKRAEVGKCLFRRLCVSAVSEATVANLAPRGSENIISRNTIATTLLHSVLQLASKEKERSSSSFSAFLRSEVSDGQSEVVEVLALASTNASEMIERLQVQDGLGQMAME